MFEPKQWYLGAGAFLATALLFMASVAGCGSAPDEKSGGDEHRNQAEAFPMGEEWATGEINADGGDTTDWKSFDVEYAGKVMVELNTDKKNAVVQVGVYDMYGQPVAKGTRKSGDQGVKIPVKAGSGGRYFIRIVQKDGDKTAYSVRAMMGDRSGDSVVPDL